MQFRFPKLKRFRSRCRDIWRFRRLRFVPVIFLLGFALRIQGATGEGFSEENSRIMLSHASWIWDRQTEDFQTCRFWKNFEIPRDASLKKAWIRITADNGYRFFLDGREIGQAGEWQRVLEYDVTAILRPGIHVIAVEAFNGTLYAGLILHLHMEFSDGKEIDIGTDKTWRIVPQDEPDWEKKTAPSASWRPATVVELLRWRPRITKGPVLQPIKIEFWQTAAFQIALFSTCSLIAILCLFLMTQLAVQRKSQRLLQLERSRLARDLHDDLGARITQLVLFGEVTQRELPAGTDTRGKLDQLCNRMRELAGAVNEVVWVVNSQRDTLRDFADFVCNYAENFLKPTPIRCRFDVSAEFPEVHFPLPVRRNLFLAVKEALNNVVKHSGASEIFLRLSYVSQMVQVVIEDNGKEIDPRNAKPDRNGIANMTQRMREFGGTCSLASGLGKGCRIEFKIPLKTSRLHSRWFKWPLRRISRDADFAKTQQASETVAS